MVIRDKKVFHDEMVQERERNGSLFVDMLIFLITN